ncbi:TonB-dependent hemoglobin/transferrin/lactoferrin family receptor [Hoeflea sp. YIM 152468]|uniref:TonB-dependent hemoglobin/transferrin/lactoferrin family receptor n=1 Tax=Hoeflea sp. YIM 152468 TaxID=3031759 RepID=UPI0023DC075B|nr:TonB-dependent hemoglobin/transferrin/lactoferrin family receptor [Hoeflea sp. YIM 152468]MDF1609088.1 TonB-dependent hemoglobin/transferrin/lactoferrin family receptor [Hoeflea sp. YIM 152468]
MTRTAVTLALCATTALTAIPAAQAQEATETGETRNGFTLLQRLILGAGRAKVAVDTPQAVTALEQEDIDDKQASTVTDILKAVPNVSVVGGANRALGQTFNIRGIGAGESASEEGRIVVNVDGVPQFFEQYRMGGFFNDPELFKRVEVLRGPASSTLYGSGALGGVINFTTKEASDYLADGQNGALKLKGSYDSNANGYLASGILAMRLSNYAEFLVSGNYRTADEFSDGDGMAIEGSDFTTPNGLAKGTFYLDENKERKVQLSYSQFTSDQDNQAYSQLQPTGFFGTVDRVVNNRQAQISYEDAATDNPWLDLKLTLSYNNITNEQSNASLGTSSNIGQDSTYGYESYQFVGQNTFEWSGDRFDNYLTVGGQLIQQERTTATADPLGHHPEGTDFQAGVFVQNEFIWNERLTLIPGVRIDYQKLSSNNSVAALAGGLMPADKTDVAFSPKLAALYKISDSFSIFGSYAHTERFPSLDEIYSNDYGAGVAPNHSPDLKKEKSNNYEMGFVVSTTGLMQDGDSLDFKTTGFYNKIDDLIIRQRNLYPQYVNVGRAEIYGVEFEAGYTRDNFFADASLGVTVGTDLSSGTGLTTVAPPEFNLGLGYRMPDRGMTVGWEGRFVFAESRVPVSATATDLVAEALRREAFNTHNLYLNWRPDQQSRFAGWEASFRVENLFDTKYRDFLSNDNGKGRTFKLTLAKQFGW